MPFSLGHVTSLHHDTFGFTFSLTPKGFNLYQFIKNICIVFGSALLLFDQYKQTIKHFSRTSNFRHIILASFENVPNAQYKRLYVFIESQIQPLKAQANLIKVGPLMFIYGKFHKIKFQSLHLFYQSLYLFNLHNHF